LGECCSPSAYGVIRPLADAAASRRAESAADRFAADHGLALQLAAALYALDDDRCAASGWSWRFLASHPTPDRQISALLAAAASPVRPPESAGAISTALSGGPNAPRGGDGGPLSPPGRQGAAQAGRRPFSRRCQ
jgi:hypothetical protein